MFLLIYLLLAGLLIAVSIANGVLTILKVLISDFFFHVVQMDQVDQGGQGGQGVQGGQVGQGGHWSGWSGWSG